jgi:hypothetical protein
VQGFPQTDSLSLQALAVAAIPEIDSEVG